MAAPTFHHCGALVAVCLLSACGPKRPVDPTPIGVAQSAPPANVDDTYVQVFKDGETGCEYLVNSWHGGLTPRIVKDMGGYHQKGCN